MWNVLFHEQPRPFAPLLAIMAMVTVTGCTHLHDDSRHAIVDKAKVQAAALVKAEQHAFDVMSSNLSIMSINEANTFKRLDADVIAVQTRTASRMKWSDLRQQATIGASGSSPLTQDLENRVNNLVDDITKELVSAEVAKGKAKHTLDAADAELDLAKAKATKWNKQIAVLEKIIELTPSLVTASTNGQIKSLDDFSAKVTEITKLGKDAQVIYSDADGNSVTNDFVSAAATLADPGQALDKGDSEAGKLLASVRNVFTPQAPGVVVTAASLAKDLAEARQHRVMAHIDMLTQRIDLAKRAQAAVAQAREFAQQMSCIGDTTKFPNDKSIGETLLELSKDPLKAEDLAKGLRGAQYYVAITAALTLQAKAAEREVYRLQHLDSIQQSKIAAMEHEALVSRGVEALAIYHEGGVKPEEIADLAFRAAQLGFLSWIGAGVH
ncbi:MAG: hypothetical protein JWM68_3603 [Verrucomicrobiales bacterium]|nr:hypothetical protein [Verrucomicrobiales bacterium]